MATNPMQRRSRQSFLVGFLVALVIMALIVIFLFMKISSLNEDLESAQKLIPQDQTVYTAVEDIKAGSELTEENFMLTKIKTAADLSGYLSPNNFAFEYNEDGTPVKYIAKVDIPGNSMLIDSMLSSGEDSGIANDLRMMEYNMIVLPTQLKNGDYVDIRFILPTGEDYIVVSKKLVEQTTASSIWIKLTEDEILAMNSAIVDSYTTQGSSIRAYVYTDPGVQEAAKITYPINNDVLNLINSNKNILEDARKALASRWNDDTNQNDGVSDFRYNRNHIDGYSAGLTEEEKASNVETGVSQEIGSLSTSRSEYVSNLEGTGLVGIVE